LLSLPKPFGWPNGIGISMRARVPVNGSVVAGVALGFGCPPFILPRVSACMEASGRYDCRVTVSREALSNLKMILEQLNVELVILDKDGGFRDHSDIDYR
jgi:hypothetical protein